MTSKKGFTLIELLIVIAVIAILAAAIFVALDPLTRFQEARDARRYNDLANVLTAVKTDQVDNGGSYLGAIAGMTAGEVHMIGTEGATGCDVACTNAPDDLQEDCIDLTPLVTEGYLGAVPSDPSNGTPELTNYYITSAANGTLTVGACAPENEAEIQLTR